MGSRFSHPAGRGAVRCGQPSLPTGQGQPCRRQGRDERCELHPAGCVRGGRSAEQRVHGGQHGQATGQTLSVPLDQLPPLTQNQLFELTLEDPRGSPTGKPTGPIQAIGRAVKVL